MTNNTHCDLWCFIKGNPNAFEVTAPVEHWPIEKIGLEEGKNQEVHKKSVQYTRSDFQLKPPRTPPPPQVPTGFFPIEQYWGQALVACELTASTRDLGLSKMRLDHKDMDQQMSYSPPLSLWE